MHLQPGLTVEGTDYRYTIESVVGRGNYGITYLAHAKLKNDPNAGGRIMALKEFFIKGINERQGSLVTYPLSDGQFEALRSNFIEEAHTLEKFNSAGIVKTYEAFDANGTSYIAMEYINGGSLKEYIDKYAPLSPSQIKAFARQLAQSLRIMHGKGMLHLDVKPSNILMRDDQPVLIDFGLSMQYDNGGKPVPEMAKTTNPSEDYYHPVEEVTARKAFSSILPVTYDVYSLSATIFSMATGRPPLPPSEFEEDFPYAVLNSVNASQELIELLEKGLKTKAKDRIQNMDDFLALVEKLPEDDKPAKANIIGSGEAQDSGNKKPGTHKVGDIHPNKKWIWLEIAPGKYDWRTISGPKHQEWLRKQNGDDADGSIGSKPAPAKENNSGLKGTITTFVIAALASIIVGYILAIRPWDKNSDSKDALPANYVENLEFTTAGGDTFVYTGEIDSTYTSAQIPDGHGIGIYNTGTYTGEYRHGVRHGQGKFDFCLDGESQQFDGEFANDLYSHGKLTLPDGTWFDGDFSNGQPYNGIWYNSDNSIRCKIKNGKQR